ncbi:MAG: toprim domain-containing protein [Hyphomonadaceae bacterium]
MSMTRHSASRLERIVHAFGGDLFDNGRRALIPGPGHSAGDRSVSLFETDDGRILIHCFSPRDDWRAVKALLIARGLLDSTPSHAPRDDRAPAQRRIIVQPGGEERVARAQRIWTEGRSIGGTAGERHLLRRAIPKAVQRSPALGFHPRMTGIDDRRRRPALLAAISGKDGAVQGVQVTLLTPYGGEKAAVATPRRVIGRLMGGAVRLHEAGSALVVGEGVETVLSASAALYLPAWAALTADNFAMFEPPSSVARLVIAPDNDVAGRRAADALAERAIQTMKVEFACPPEDFNDWNDWARKHMREKSDV